MGKIALKKIVFIIAAVIIAFPACMTEAFGMYSDNYRIDNSAVSAGGGDMSGIQYKMETSAAGQQVFGSYSTATNRLESGLLPATSEPAVATVSNILTPVDKGAVRGTSCQVTGSAASPNGIAYVEITFDDGHTWNTVAGTTAWSYNWNPLPTDGVYTLKSRAHDSVGNIETPGAGNTFTIDNIPPSSLINSPTGGTFQGSSISIAGSAADGIGSGVKQVEVGITPAGGQTTWYKAGGTGGWSYSWSPTINGDYTIQSRATDNAGNLETPGAGVTVKVDNSYMLMGYSQNGTSVTLTATVYYKGQISNIPKGKSISFYEQTTKDTGTATVLKGSAATRGGVATFKFHSAKGAHEAYAKFAASGGIPSMQSNTVSYTIEKVQGLSVPSDEETSAISSGFVVNTPTPALSWTPFPTGATAYYMQISASNKFPANAAATHTYDFTTSGNPAGISWPAWSPSAFQLTKGKKFYWRVQAVMPSGKSVYSDSKTLTYKSPTTIKASLQQDGLTVKITAELDGDAGAVSGKKLYFYDTTGTTPVLKAKAYTAAKSDGTYAVGTIASTIGPHSYVVKFNGDAYYLNTASDVMQVDIENAAGLAAVPALRPRRW
jgi:Bacterial Ig domain